MTTAVHVRDLRGFEQRTIALERDAKGNWRSTARGRALKGARTSTSAAARPRTRCRSAGCGLGVGATKTIQAAWVRFPELTVVKAAQTYTRLDEFTYRYASGTFEAELTVDDDGLVTTYAEWRRTGVAFGPDDSEPLDADRAGSIGSWTGGR